MTVLLQLHLVLLFETNAVRDECGGTTEPVNVVSCPVQGLLITFLDLPVLHERKDQRTSQVIVKRAKKKRR